MSVYSRQAVLVPSHVHRSKDTTALLVVRGMAAILLDNSDDARKNHIAYFARCLEGLSHHYESLDFSRMTLIYFCVVALDLLGGLESVVDDGSPNGGWRAR